MSEGYQVLGLIFFGAILLGPWYLEIRWIASVLHRGSIPPNERLRFAGFSAAVIAWTLFVAWTIQIAVGLSD